MPILLTRSPCIGVCSIGDGGRCEGCGRRKKEIRQWKSLADEQRHDINMRLLATAGKKVRKQLLAALRREVRAAEH